MTDRNDPAVIARRWFEEVWNDRRDAAIDELMTPTSKGHVEGQGLVGPDEFRKMRATFLGAVPDTRVVIEDVIAQGDRAAVRWRFVGTHGGDHFGFPATNQKIDARGSTWLIIRDGRVVEGYDTWNLGALMQSLQEAAAKAK